jgi:hypothetical protein
MELVLILLAFARKHGNGWVNLVADENCFGIVDVTARSFTGPYGGPDLFMRCTLVPEELRGLGGVVTLWFLRDDETESTSLDLQADGAWGVLMDHLHGESPEANGATFYCPAMDADRVTA